MGWGRVGSFFGGFQRGRGAPIGVFRSRRPSGILPCWTKGPGWQSEMEGFGGTRWNDMVAGESTDDKPLKAALITEGEPVGSGESLSEDEARGKSSLRYRL